MTCIALLAALGIGLSGCAETTSAPSADTSFYKHLTASDDKVDAVAARDMISIYRRNHGLSLLAIDPRLQAEADMQAHAMAKADKVSHDLQGDLAHRLDRAGYPHAAAVENVSAGYVTLAEAFSGWRDSPPHNQNMLDPRMRRMGIAAAYSPGSKYHVYWSLVMSD